MCIKKHISETVPYLLLTFRYYPSFTYPACISCSYGEGVYQYFDFIIYLMLTNVVLTATGLIPLIAHFVIDGWVWLESGRYHENLFTSTYSPGIRPVRNYRLDKRCSSA
jgi:hypothetical protein